MKNQMNSKLSKDAEAIVEAGLRAARTDPSADSIDQAIRHAVGSLSLECSLRERGQAAVEHALMQIAQAYVFEKAARAA
jgi:hypothetical protein